MLVYQRVLLTKCPNLPMDKHKTWPQSHCRVGRLFSAELAPFSSTQRTMWPPKLWSCENTGEVKRWNILKPRFGLVRVRSPRETWYNRIWKCFYMLLGANVQKYIPWYAPASLALRWDKLSLDKVAIELDAWAWAWVISPSPPQSGAKRYRRLPGAAVPVVAMSFDFQLKPLQKDLCSRLESWRLSSKIEMENRKYWNHKTKIWQSSIHIPFSESPPSRVLWATQVASTLRSIPFSLLFF